MLPRRDTDQGTCEEPLHKTAIVGSVLFISVLVAAVFGQCIHHDFVSFDDPIYMFENPQVVRGLTADGFRWAFRTFHAANWHPVTWLSHMAVVEAFGLAPAPHHVVNIVIHLMNTVLLFLLLSRVTGFIAPSLLVAALFGIHPQNVEVVAWISARKDLLCALFWILATWTYIESIRVPSSIKHAGVSVLFLLGLMSKPMIVTLPLTFLLLDLGPLGRRPSLSLLREKIPLFLLATASCVITVAAQSSGGAVQSFDVIPLFERIANIPLSVMSYLVRLFWPSSLGIFYPHPVLADIPVPAWKPLGATLTLALLTTLAVALRHRRPVILTGWVFFLATLAPVSGIVQAGNAAMADRYAYIPTIGIFSAFAFTLFDLARNDARRMKIASVAAATVVLLLALVAWRQTSFWKNSVTIYERTLAVTERNWLVRNNLGNFYSASGRDDDAVREYKASLAIRPDFPGAWNNLGVVLMRKGEFIEATRCFRAALETSPEFAKAWNNLGEIEERNGRYDTAAESYRKATEVEPGSAESWYRLGRVEHLTGRPDLAIARYRRALSLEPGHADAWTALGNALDRLGDRQGAEQAKRERLRLKSTDRVR